MLLAVWDASLHLFLVAFLQGMLSTKPTSDTSLFPKAALMFPAAVFFTHSPLSSSAGHLIQTSLARSCLTQISHFTRFFFLKHTMEKCSVQETLVF